VSELEQVDCTSCGSKSHTEVGKVDVWGVRRCDRCHMVFVSPRPNADHTEAIYGESYFDGTSAHGNQSELGGYQANAPGLLARGRLMVRWVTSITGSGSGHSGTWLDIGCGPGYLVQTVINAGFRGVGVDISPDAVKFGREALGLDLHQSTAENILQVVTGPFSYISMIDTLFHLREPGLVMRHVSTLLEPGGYLFAGPFDLTCEATASDTPDYRSWGVPEHLNFVNEESMRYLLTDLGFDSMQFLQLPLTPGDIVSSRFKFVPAGLARTARAIVRKLPRFQNAVHGLAAKSVNARAGYVLARRPL